ncbi:MAG: 4-hydroxybenzoyl-CoA thioesterase [Burkholderiales bacterium PBB3]|nr:MAG: 4-hydroxybenzoyl-CoA thioesterase [Burkholderiales bacterium PBB3]
MTTLRSDFRLFHRLRVRWAEVDMQKIVFNGHYLMYLDTAISDYWRAMAFPYEAGMLALGGDLYVKKASVEYHGSARYDDLLDVGLRCQRIGTSSITFAGAIFAGDALLITAELIYVFADPTTQTSKPVPDTLRQALEAFEAGKAMTRMQVGDWALLSAGASTLREAVFVQEQGIGAHMVWDDLDARAVHAVSFNAMQVAVASGRLLQPAPGLGRIGRMAVNRALRGADLGKDVLLALVAASQARGDTEVSLHAQCSAEGFYLKNGFVARGDVFEEAGIRHIDMVQVF